LLIDLFLDLSCNSSVAFKYKINKIFDGIKNYIVTHYKTNSRSDTEYWIQNRENKNISNQLEQILDTWDKGGDLLAELRSQADFQVYSPTSWYCLLAGVGRFPRNLKKPKKKFIVYDHKESAKLCKKITDEFPDHKTTIENLALS